MEDIYEQNLRMLLSRYPFLLRNVSKNNLKLFVEAFTHPSFASESLNIGIICKDNQRLEFLGDSFLKFAVCYFLLNKSENAEDMNRRKERLIENNNLAKIFEFIDGCQSSIRISQKNKANINEAGIRNMYADTMEAVIGAMFISYGIEKSLSFIGRLFSFDVDSIDNKIEYQQLLNNDTSSKTILLGDSILEFIICLYVYNNTKYDEGRMTSIKQEIISKNSLSNWLKNDLSPKAEIESFKTKIAITFLQQGFDIVYQMVVKMLSIESRIQTHEDSLESVI